MGMFSQLAQGVDWSSMGQMILRIAAVLLCLVIHEVSHGLAAYHLGDPTAKSIARLVSIQARNCSKMPARGRSRMAILFFFSRCRMRSSGPTKSLVASAPSFTMPLK